jgi:hypothetical protein
MNWIRINVTQMQDLFSQIETVWDRWIRITVTENRFKLWSVTFHGEIVMDTNLKSTLFYQFSVEYKGIRTRI